MSAAPPVASAPLPDPDLPAFARSNAPLVSIVIAAGWDGAAALRTLRAVARHRPRCAIEVIVVEDPARGAEPGPLTGIPGLRRHGTERPLGRAAALDRAAALARGRFLHVLAAGAEPADGWLEALLDTLSRPGCGLVGSKLLGPDGRVVEVGAIVRRDGTRVPQGRGDRPERGLHNHVRRVDCCSIGSLLIPADLLAAVGGFAAPGVWPGDVDADLAYRVRAAGREVYVQPRSVVAWEADGAPGDPAGFAGRWRAALDAQAEAAFVARERGAGRRTILVVDHYLPEPDRDAGSRSMGCMLQQLVDMGFTVKFWPDNLQDNRRYALPLEAIGIEILHGSEHAGRFEAWIEANGRFVHHAILGRPHIARNYVGAVRRHSPAQIVYWGADIHHLRMAMQAQVRPDPATETGAAAMRTMEETLWRDADIVLYHSGSELEVVRRTVPGRRTGLLPIYFYEPGPEPAGPDGRADLLFVAGFRHPPNVDAAAWLVGEILPLVRRAVPGVRLTLAGADPTPAVLALAGPDVTVTGGLTEAALAARYGAARVALVPLRFGGGVKGKVLEALHAGVPLVTTSVGVQGLPGLAEIAATADDPPGFAAHAVRLLRDDASWRAAAAAGRDYIARNFPPERMRDALRDALSPPRGG